MGHCLDCDRNPCVCPLKCSCEQIDCAKCNPPLAPLPVSKESPTEILEGMAETFHERNKVYGDNYKMVPLLVKVLFPDGVPPGLVETDQWHLFELKLVKLSRFAISNLTHRDSIHDDAVYGAMIESILSEGEQQ